MPEIDYRAVGRAISRAANATVEEALRAHREMHRSVMRRIAITGAPGSGKSTLTGSLARHRLEKEQDALIAVLAVDPTSRYSGGAILGDRLRMDSAAPHPRLFIRSLASRQAAEGIADNMSLIFDVLEDAGFDETLTETVGTGQIDFAARELADTVVLVINPESGDFVQAMKSGIMEAADIFVVNKADLPAASKTVTALRSGSRFERRSGWTPPLIETSKDDPDSIAGLSRHIDEHQEWLGENMDCAALASDRRLKAISMLVERTCRASIEFAREKKLTSYETLAFIADDIAYLAKVCDEKDRSGE